jgi:hypothetical protein
MYYSPRRQRKRYPNNHQEEPSPLIYAAMDYAGGGPSKKKQKIAVGGATPRARDYYGTDEAPSWKVSSWLLSTSLLQIISTTLLGHEEGQQDDLSHITGLSEDGIDTALQKALPGIKKLLKDSVDKLKAQPHVDAAELNAKFLADEDGFTFTFNPLKTFHDGLEGYIGLPNPRFGQAMKDEHCSSRYAERTFDADPVFKVERTSAKAEWDFVVNGTDSWGGKRWVCPEHGSWVDGSWAGMGIADFCARPDARAAGLLWEEVVALRLYTGPMYKWYNSVLRGVNVDYDAQKEPFDEYKLAGEKGYSTPFVTTLHVLNSAIRKLSQLTRAERVYRGTKGGALSEKFWKPNEKNIRGGVELSFMSTTLLRDIALQFAQNTDSEKEQASVLFEINMGMVDRGASVEWVSQVPKEKEILFAPLTGIQVVGHPTVEGSTIVVGLRLNCNPHDLTIDQVLAKMKKTHEDLIHAINTDMLDLGFSESSLWPLTEHAEKYKNKDGQWFISAENYKKATNDTLDAKLEVCSQLLRGRTSSAHAMWEDSFRHSEKRTSFKHFRLFFEQKFNGRCVLTPEQGLALEQEADTEKADNKVSFTDYMKVYTAMESFVAANGIALGVCGAKFLGTIETRMREEDPLGSPVKPRPKLKKQVVDELQLGLAADILLHPSDSDALSKGIAAILSDAMLLERYGPKLDKIADVIGGISRLDLKDQELTAPLPESVLKLLGSAEYFNLTGNSFSNIDPGTALHDMYA